MDASVCPVNMVGWPNGWECTEDVMRKHVVLLHLAADMWVRIPPLPLKTLTAINKVILG